MLQSVLLDYEVVLQAILYRVGCDREQPRKWLAAHPSSNDVGKVNLLYI